ncbi:hypothetical protein MMC13_002379 [Lambiella insularis]|nr:hypothetical protein [Lambiella insularis]
MNGIKSSCGGSSQANPKALMYNCALFKTRIIPESDISQYSDSRIFKLPKNQPTVLIFIDNKKDPEPTLEHFDDDGRLNDQLVQIYLNRVYGQSFWRRISHRWRKLDTLYIVNVKPENWPDGAWELRGIEVVEE